MLSNSIDNQTKIWFNTHMKKIFSLVVINNVEYKMIGSHSLDFHKFMTEMAEKSARQWEGNIKGIVDVHDNDKRAATILAWDVYGYLKTCWWWNDSFKSSITVRCAKSEINTEARLWWNPCTSSSDLTVNLGDLQTS